MSVEISLFTPELILPLLGIGALGGFLSGLLGIGGGIIFVPGLLFFFHAIGFDSPHAMHMAVATSLAIIIVTAASSARSNYKRGNMDVALFKKWIPFVLAGVACGALIASLMNGDILKRAFVAMLGLMALYMFLSKEKNIDASVHEHAALPKWVQFLGCYAIGFILPMLGVGGGSFLIPWMTFNGMKIKRAIGTGPAFNIANAHVSAIIYMLTGPVAEGPLLPYSVGFVNFPALLAIAPASVLFAPLGVRAAHYMPVLILRRGFSILLLIVAYKMYTKL